MWSSVRYRLASPVLLGVNALRWLEGERRAKGFRILLFHGISEEREAAFGQLLEHLLKGQRILSPGEAETWVDGSAQQIQHEHTPFLLTFDDGFLSNARLVKNVLSPNGVKAVFFVCPGLMDLPPASQREAVARSYVDSRSAKCAPLSEHTLMSWSELEELLALGQTIGSHGLSHQRLSSIRPGEQEREIIGSADLLLQRLGMPVRWFAFSFGDLGSIDEPSCRLVVRHYKFCCSGVRGLNSSGTDPCALAREQIDLAAPLAYQVCASEGALDYPYARKAMRLQRMFRAARSHVQAYPARAVESSASIDS
ncbi:MAG: polysaccharide deacetylase family protein [candidate division NC10 bacterium]|nr:polysaccharide deacetylase family protein [candidate division NC10 bacterium]